MLSSTAHQLQQMQEMQAQAPSCLARLPQLHRPLSLPLLHGVPLRLKFWLSLSTALVDAGHEQNLLYLESF